jgi:hypothetical protein
MPVLLNVLSREVTVQGESLKGAKTGNFKCLSFNGSFSAKRAYAGKCCALGEFKFFEAIVNDQLSILDE